MTEIPLTWQHVGGGAHKMGNRDGIDLFGLA